MQITFICESCDTNIVLETKGKTLKTDDIPRCNSCKTAMVRSKPAMLASSGKDADDQIMQAINSYRKDNPHTRMVR